jgi:cellulose synthase/poly-beta-1,6-N-acetylglucosamine synthase-like glycosyltransferase
MDGGLPQSTPFSRRGCDPLLYGVIICVAKDGVMTSILIVVANYNGEQLLPTCLPSLRAQTCPRTDIVVVDNCSNDNSIDVAKAHGVRVLEMRRNDGLGLHTTRAL